MIRSSETICVSTLNLGGWEEQLGGGGAGRGGWGGSAWFEISLVDGYHFRLFVGYFGFFIFTRFIGKLVYVRILPPTISLIALNPIRPVGPG